MSATPRLILVLAAAAFAGACSDESTDAAVASADGSTAGGDEALIADGAVATGATGSSAAALFAGSGDGASLAEIDDAARLMKAVVALNVDNEAAINRTLLEFGAGVGKRDEARASRIVDLLTRFMKNERPVVRRGALALLGRMPPGVMVGDPFAPALFDFDPGVRRQAVYGRASHGIASTWRQLTPLAGDADPAVRVAVAQSLALVAQPEARDLLARLLADPNDGVVEAAAASLCVLDVGATPTQAFDAARSLRPTVRCSAAKVLARARTGEAMKQLLVMTADEAPIVRQEAAWALSGVSDGFADDARAAVESIAFDARHRGRGERFEALQGLARVESDPDHERLLAVAEKDKDVMLRTIAARSLALRGDPRALPALAALLDVEAASADGVAQEEAVFERRTADAVLSELAGVEPGSRSSVEWRKALPDMAARLSAGRPDRPPPRLAQQW